MVECPICRLRMAERYIPHHVWSTHAYRSRCWCGDEVVDQYTQHTGAGLAHEQFKRHCDKNGGYLAHYLEHKLVGDDG
jgi:hypothetical protein